MSVRHWWRALLIALLPLTTVMAESVADSSLPASANARLLGPALRSTDLERSTRFYTAGLGMVVATTLKLGPVTEVIFSFGTDRSQPVILLYKDETSGKSPPIEHGNGFGRLVLRVTDATALAKHLAAAGYAAGGIHANAVNHMKVFWVEDPDGYTYEITEVSASKR